MLKVGSCFSAPTRPSGRHIYFAIAEIEADRFLCVNATDRNNISDLSCILPSGSHPIIKKESAIYYQKAKTFTRLNYDAMRRARIVIEYMDVAPDVLAKIIDGGKLSADLANEFKAVLP